MGDFKSIREICLELVKEPAQPQGEQIMRQKMEALTQEIRTSGLSYGLAVQEFKKRFILLVLNGNKGNRCKASRELGMHRNTLARTTGHLGLKQDRKNGIWYDGNLKRPVTAVRNEDAEAEAV